MQICEIKAGFVLELIKPLKIVNIKQTFEILFNEKKQAKCQFPKQKLILNEHPRVSANFVSIFL